MKKSFWLVTAIVILVAGSFGQNRFVYTNDNASPATTGAPNSVSAFQVNPDGTLTLLAGSPFATGGNGTNGGRTSANDIAIVQQGERERPVSSFLYAVNQGDGTLAAFHIDPNTGNLTALRGSPFFIDGPLGGDYSITASPNGAFLFVVNDATTVIRSYQVLPNGALLQVHGSPFETGTNWLGMKVSGDGRFLVTGEELANNVGVFNISRFGSLSPVAGSPFPGSGESSGVTVNCGGTLAFHIDFSQDVDVYRMDSNGALTAVTGFPFTTPTGFSQGLTLNPSGDFLYVSDPFGQNNNSYISGFGVAEDGTLTPVPGSPFTASFGPGGVAGITTSQDGKYLYSYMFVFSQVDVQTIAADGTLTDMGSFFTGLPASGGGMGIASFPPPSCR